MLQEIALLRRDMDSSGGRYVHDCQCRLLDIIEGEVRRRLEFEEALRQYLQDSPGKPFAAAGTLLQFLNDDLSSEQSVR